MVHLLVLETDNPAVEGAPNDRAKTEEIVSEPSISSAKRRKLGDISNLPHQATLINHAANQMHQQRQHQNNNLFISSKEYVEKLQKENMMLMKVLAERNKIIELSNIELQKLRINLQKVQEQNLQFAQANTQMLAELNTNRDRLKTLQHKLGCENGLLKARKMELEELTIPKIHHASENEARANNLHEAGEAFQADDVDYKSSKRKQQPRTKSLGSSNIKSVPVHEKANKKRRVSGRMSPTKCEEMDNPDDLKVTSQIKDIGDNKQFLSNGPNRIRENVDNKMFVDEARQIPKNVVNKRLYTARQSAKFECGGAEQTENLNEMDDAKGTKENERPSLRRRSARIKGLEPEPSENLHEMHEIKETTKRRCSVRRQSHGSKSEALESAEILQGTHDTKEITGKQRTSMRRQSTNYKQHQTAAAADAIINARSAEPPSHKDTVEECNSQTEPKTEADETEGTRRTSVGRPLRHTASKVSSYKEVSLKVKMRRPE